MQTDSTTRAAFRSGVVVFALAVLLCLLLRDPVVRAAREAALDVVLAATAGPPSGQVTVLAIDQQELQDFGPWPWPRARLALVIQRMAAANPRVIGVDLVLSGPDRAGPAGLARAVQGLPDDTGAGAAALLALQALPDGDAQLARALTGGVPVALGAALSDHAAPPPPVVALLSAGPPVPTTPWAAQGIEAPVAALATAAAGIGIASLGGEDEGRVRRVPLLVLAGNTAAPGLAVEVLRLANRASALRIGGGLIRLGDLALPLGPAADLRLRPTDPATWPMRTRGLSAFLAAPDDLSGQIVLLGLTAPVAASLRPTAVSPLAPSVQIQADAVETMLSDRLLRRPDLLGWIEAAASLILALGGLAAAARLAPLAGIATVSGLSLAWAASAAAIWLRAGLAIDPMTPAVLCLITGLAGVTAAAVTARRHAAALRRRFERHLSPAVVARMAQTPNLSRLPGENRIVTALFTDLEGFTARAETLPPAQLIAILDRYFHGLTLLIHSHGGMIGKFVGDAAHVLFNAPFDLPDHASRATDCALALRAYGEAFAADPQNGGLGRTRIGLETGPVVVGDVGSGEKLDYTAHGRTMNLAARLEQAGKRAGQGVLAGPGVVAATPGRGWVPLGQIDLQGLGQVSIWSPERPDQAPTSA